MKTFSGLHPKGFLQQIFNYRLSRARRVVENAFCISSSIFRVLRKPFLLEPQKVDLVVRTRSTSSSSQFLSRNPKSLNMCSPSALSPQPSGSMDYILNGELVNGSWGNGDYDNWTSLLPLRIIPRRSCLAVK